MVRSIVGDVSELSVRIGLNATNECFAWKWRDFVNQFVVGRGLAGLYLAHNKEESDTRQ